MNYRKLNLYLGWFVFLIATIVYMITIEDTVSLWDCGEYITAAYKLEVGHPPGAPTFMVIARIFSFFAEPENVAVWINRLSALSSSMTILFMFWSLTMLLKKLSIKGKEMLSKGDEWAILGSALIGSLAYTFSDSFWFSAVEGEVYAMSSLFTAVIFWAILRWDEEMATIQGGQLRAGYSPDRWLLLIMFLLGLAIGVHLLGILVVPAIAFLIYFRYRENVDLKGIILVGILSVIILGFIQEAVIPGTVTLASKFEITFVNSFGLPFYSGTIFFFLILVGLCIYLLRWARKKGRRIVYTSVMGLVLLLIGYGSFAVIVIRSNANPPLDENDPENLVTLRSYLKREQYGSAPILFGQWWNSKENERSLYKDAPPIHLRRFVVLKNESVLKAFKDENRAKEYAKTISGSRVEEKYFETNASGRQNAIPTYAQTTFFPRMYWNQDARKISGYKNWSGYSATDDKGGEIGKDGNRLPTFGENLKYFGRYQVTWMYWRYFMWNFAGRQNDIQGHGSAMRGNWISGIEFLDRQRLGAQGENAPYYTSENKSNNKFFLLPLILGFIGLFFHFGRAPKDAFVLFLAFLFTGLAIVVYLNQKPFEPRERDYAYAGSFYFFAFWIGIGVYALYDAFKRFGKEEFKWMGIIGGAGAVFLTIFGMNTAVTWILMLVVAAILIGIMVGLRKVLKNDTHGALVATLLCLIVPVIMGMQGWDDHDRSNKTSAHNLALNYLNSCEENGIIFTNGDNDTFPLWYMQEVEGKRTDVRVCNLSLMQTDWYTDQMKMKAYESDPLPIKFTEDQILMNAGNTDQVMFSDLFDLFYLNVDHNKIKQMIDIRLKQSEAQMKMAAQNLIQNGPKLLASVNSTDPRITGTLNNLKAKIVAPLTGNSTNDVFMKLQAGVEILSATRKGLVTGNAKDLQAFQEMLIKFESDWNFSKLSDAMEFVRNDDNIISFPEGRRYRVFPSSGFVLPVNKENAVKSGIITKDQLDNCLDEIRFRFDKAGLTKEQVMMLDIFANNEWKRAVYFSSPYGSDVSIALLRGAGTGGYIRQNGMAYELSPLGLAAGRLSIDKMYTHLMETYDYGAMNDPDVLTDYYARRHTSQYRRHFFEIAQEYMKMALRAEMEWSQYEFAMERNPDMPVKKPKVSKEQMKEYNDKAVALIKKSLEVMPPETVIDYGEPSQNPNPSESYNYNGVSLDAYTDGMLHNYVSLLFNVGAKEEASKLGMKVADQLESIIDYYDKSPVHIAANPDNTIDLYAALEAYLSMYENVMNKDVGDPDGELAKRMTQKVDYIWTDMFESMFDELEELANQNGESTRRGSRPTHYARMLFELQDYSRAIAIKYQLMDPQPTAPEPNPQPIQNMPVMPQPPMQGGGQ